MAPDDQVEFEAHAQNLQRLASRLPTLATPPAPEAEPDPVAETVTKTTGMEAVV
jgi:hypothetical protein